MKKAKKVVALALCAVMLVVGSVAGTLAYLQDKDEVVNTFTVGKVDIKLDEAPVDVNGAATTGDRVKQNSYKLMPGHEYDKDPTVTVLAGSEDAYVRALVTVTYKAAADTVIPADFFKTWIEGYNTNWAYNSMTPSRNTIDGVDWITRTYELRYANVVPASTTDTKLDAIFTGINMPGTLTNDQLATLDGLRIDVVAQAIQKDTFGTADAAWAVFNNTQAPVGTN